MAEWPSYAPTRNPWLGLCKTGGHKSQTIWRFVALDQMGPDGTPSTVGPHYRSKAEALADLQDYADRSGWGWSR